MIGSFERVSWEKKERQAGSTGTTCDSYHRDGEADGDHDNVMQHHEELPAQVAGQRRGHVFGRGRRVLVPFDLQLVPVAHEHCVDVVHKIRDSEHDVGAGQPVPVGGRAERRET